MPSVEYEVNEGMAEDVEFQYLVYQTAVVSKDGVHASGVRFVRCKLGDPDAGGRRRPIPIPGTEVEIEVDTVIAAFCQDSDPSWIHAGAIQLELEPYRISLVERE